MLEYLWILQRTLHFRPLLGKFLELQVQDTLSLAKLYTKPPVKPHKRHKLTNGLE